MPLDRSILYRSISYVAQQPSYYVVQYCSYSDNNIEEKISTTQLTDFKYSSPKAVSYVCVWQLFGREDQR